MNKSYYFPHDYSTTSDPKIICLLGNHGGFGYGIFWRIIELLYQEKTHKLPLKKYLYEAIASQMLAKSEEVEKIIFAMICDFELFQKDDEFFWSDRVLRNITEVDEKYQKLHEIRSKAGKSGNEARWSKSQVIASTSQKSLNKIKLNKIKYNNINNNIRVTLEEQLKPFLAKYAPSLVKDFTLYWEETTVSGKQRWQLEKTWDVKKRLERWNRNELKWAHQRDAKRNGVESVVVRNLKSGSGFQPVGSLFAEVINKHFEKQQQG